MADKIAELHAEARYLAIVALAGAVAALIAAIALLATQWKKMQDAIGRIFADRPNGADRH